MPCLNLGQAVESLRGTWLFFHSSKNTIVIFIAPSMGHGTLIIVFIIIITRNIAHFYVALIWKWLCGGRQHVAVRLEVRACYIGRYPVHILSGKASRQWRDRWDVCWKMDRPSPWSAKAAERFHGSCQFGLIFIQGKVVRKDETRCGWAARYARVIITPVRRPYRGRGTRQRRRWSGLIWPGKGGTATAISLGPHCAECMWWISLLACRRWRCLSRAVVFIIYRLRSSRRSGGIGRLVTIIGLDWLRRRGRVLVHANKDRGSLE